MYRGGGVQRDVKVMTVQVFPLGRVEQREMRCGEMQVFFADFDCRELCETRTSCDADVDEFLCRLGCTPTVPETAYRRACADISACGELAGCLDLEANPLEGCGAICDEAVECGVFGGDRDVCLAECTGRDAAEVTGDDYLNGVSECLEDAVGWGNICDADEAEACFATASCELTPFEMDLGAATKGKVLAPDFCPHSTAGKCEVDQTGTAGFSRSSN